MQRKGSCSFKRDMVRNKEAKENGSKKERENRNVISSRFFSRSFLALLLLFVFCILTSCSGKGHPAFARTVRRSKVILNYGVLGEKDEQRLKMAKRFAKEVKEKSLGRIEVKILSLKEQENDLALLEQFRAGNLDIARLSLTTAKKLSPKLSLLEMPYLFADEEEMWNVLDGEKGALFQEDFRSKGMEILVWNCLGFRDFYTVQKPLRTVDDFEGVILGVEDESRMGKALQLLSGKTQEVSQNKIYKALQSGTVHGSENTLEEFASLEHSSSAKYFLEDEHSPVLDLQILSPKAKENLSESDVKLVKEIAFSLAVQERAYGKKAKQELRNRLSKRGVIFTRFSTEDKKEIEEMLAPLYEESKEQEFLRKLGKIN